VGEVDLCLRVVGLTLLPGHFGLLLLRLLEPLAGGADLLQPHPLRLPPLAQWVPVGVVLLPKPPVFPRSDLETLAEELLDAHAQLLVERFLLLEHRSMSHGHMV